MQEFIRRAVTTGLDVQGRMIEFLDNLVQRGKMDEKEREEFLKELDAKMDRSKEWMEDLASDVTRRISERNPFICKKEFDALKEQADRLSKRVASLEAAAKKEQKA